MQCYSELVPPSGVTHSLHISFTTADASNLIVVRSSILQIFAHKQINNGQDTKLLLVAEFPLSGTVTSLGRVKLLQSKSGGDALLLAFRDAKLSLIEWDPNQHSISTISIHYYENHDLLSCPWTPEVKDTVSHLTVDPSSRCAAFNFGVHNLAIVPFHQSADDLAMDDFDDLDDEKLESETKQTNGQSDEHSTPYSPSFVLPLTVLDPGLLHPIDLTFLHEYREPTLGILYSTAAPSNNLTPERKDVMIYTVYTLDIEQRASTTLLSITALPNDLYKAISLPLPVGGTLLVGGNEVIHVDQGGKTNAVGVNEFAKNCSAFPMADRSEYRMRLEGCQIEQLGSSAGDMLVTLSTGELLVLNFRLDGRSVSGLSLRPVITDYPLVTTMSSTMTHIGLGRVFIGSEESDSVLLSTAKRIPQLKRGSSKVHVKTEDDENFDMNADGLEDDDDDDDLYAGDHANGTNGHAVEGSNFRLLDRLPSLGVINDVTLGRPAKRKRNDEEGEFTELSETAPLEIALACCRGQAGSLAFLSRELVPRTIKRTKYDSITGVWSIKAQNDEGESDESNIDDTVILTEKTLDGSGRSILMTLLAGELKQKDGTEFDGNTTTVTIGRLSASNHTVQVSANDVRVYDADFGLSQIFPIVDEDSDETAQAIAAICVDPYVLFLKTDQTFSVLKADKSGELDEIDLPANIPSKAVVWASIYRDSTDFFGTSRYRTDSSSDLILLSILEQDGTFGLYSLLNPKIQVFQYHGLDFLPPALSPDSPIPKHWKVRDEVEEILLSDIGDEVHQSPYLIVRNSTGDISIYQPHSVPEVEGSFRFQKITTANADVNNDEDEEEFDPMSNHSRQHLQLLPNIDGLSAVFVTGSSPCLVVRIASGVCRIHRFHSSNVKYISPINDSSCPNGLLFIDGSDNLNFSTLPSDVTFSLSDFLLRRVPLYQEVTAISYYDRTQSYLLAVNHPTVFQLPQDDEWHPEWTEEVTGFLPTSYQSSLQLMSSKSNKILHTYPMDPNEQILTLKTLNLSISEESGERKDLIVVGTAVTKGENVVTRGNIYIFDLVDVVPHPDIPESDLRLKLITKEDVRGSASAITDIGSQGFLLASQGQKAMVRGLKEDKTLLPVGFLDMRFHVAVARELKGTGLTILGDAFSGLWLMGYSEEPYKMQILGRDLDDPEVVTADFLPQGKELYIISSDSDGELRVLQYDPENPKTERGQKLLLRSTFNTGALPTTMTLLPRTPTSTELSNMPATRVNEDSDYDSMDLDNTPQPLPSQSSHQLLLTTASGSICLITPLAEQSYRRLSTLSNILTSNLSHHAGLNPRAYRNVETDGIGGRAMIDGNLVRRWLSGSSWHKKTLADKVGGSVWELRGDLEIVSGGGLGFI